MLSVRVEESFIDTHTGEVHPLGEVFEATEERVEEIRDVNSRLISIIEKKRKVKEHE